MTRNNGGSEQSTYFHLQMPAGHDGKFTDKQHQREGTMRGAMRKRGTRSGFEAANSIICLSLDDYEQE